MIRVLAGLLVMAVVVGCSSTTNPAVHPAGAPAWLDTGTPSSTIAMQRGSRCALPHRALDDA